MAKYLGTKNNKPFFIKNGDRYSISTSQHQALVQQYCQGPTVSRTALEASGIYFKSITQENIIDYTQDYHSATIYREKDTGKYYKQKITWAPDKQGKYKIKSEEIEFHPPKQRMFIKYQDNNLEDRFSAAGYWHILGGTLIKKEMQYYLCSLDENNYFVAQLSTPTKTVEEAFESLKPKPIKKAIKQGIKVKRQGEWFFIPTGLDDNKMAQKLGISKTQLRNNVWQRELPSNDHRTNSHRAILIPNNTCVIKLSSKKKKIEKRLSFLKQEYNDLFLEEIKENVNLSPEEMKQHKPEQYHNLVEQFQNEYYHQNNQLKEELFQLRKKIDELFTKEKIYARGMVIHSDREHRPLRLTEWHEIHKNTEIRSWSANGKFD
jgi:uncharacterized protein YeaO (DUF488 family)